MTHRSISLLLICVVIEVILSLLESIDLALRVEVVNLSLLNIYGRTLFETGSACSNWLGAATVGSDGELRGCAVPCLVDDVQATAFLVEGYGSVGDLPNEVRVCKD